MTVLAQAVNPYWRLAAVYLLLALISLALSRQQGGMASLWYANAAGVAFLVRYRWHDWLGLLFACAAANLAANLLYGDSIWRALSFLPGNLLEISLAGLLIKYWRLDRQFMQAPEYMLRLLTLGVLLPGFVSATCGSLIMELHGLMPFEQVFPIWYCSSAVGGIALLPVLLLWKSTDLQSLGEDWLRFGLIFTGLALGNFIVLRYVPDPFIYLVLIWISISFVLPSVQTCLLVALGSLQAALLLAFHLLPAWADTTGLDPLGFFTPLSLVLFCPLLVSSALLQRRLLLDSVRQGRDQVEAIFESSPGALLVCNAQGRLTKANGHAHRLFSAASGQLLQKPLQSLLPGLTDLHHRPTASLFTAHRIDASIFPAEVELQLLTQDADEPLWIVALRDLSIEQQHQRALQDSERFLRTLTDNLPAAVAYVDKEQRLRFTNQTYRHWFAADKAFLNRPVLQLAAESSNTQTLHALRQAILGTGATFEYEIPGKHIQAFYIPDWQDGLVNGVLIIRHDITDIKQTQAKLSETSQFLDAVIEHIPNMLFMKDAADLRFVLLNRAGEQLLGFQRQQLIGRSDWDFFPPEQAKHFVDTDRQVLNGRLVSVQEEEIQTRLRGVRVLRTHKTALCDEQGKPRYLLGISEDITETRHSQSQQLALMALQSAILDNAAFAIVATDPQGMITVFNRAAEQMLGYQAQELVGQQTPEVFHDAQELERRAIEFAPELGEVLQDGFELLIAKTRLGKENRHEWTYLRKDGSKLPVLLSVTDLRDSEQQLTGYLGLAIDMTGPKLAEQEREYSRKQAELASRAKTEFVANMSHEIRTPMNAVLGISRLLIQTPLDAEQRQLLKMLQTAGESLLQLLNDILDFSKIEAGRLELEPVEFSLDSLLQSLSTIMAMNAASKSLELVIQNDSRWLGTLCGDELRLKQVLVNLIGNAIKFTEQGMVKLSVQQLEPTGLASPCFRFSIQDTGIGMDTEQLQRLFMPFTQADASMTRRFGGTGLGLTISKRLVELMGGQIEVQTEPGVGSCFRMELPLSPVTAFDSQYRTRIKRVLIAETKPETQQALRQICASLGWQVVSVDRLGALIEQCQAGYEVFDLLLLSWQLFDGDWQSLHKQLAVPPGQWMLMLASHQYQSFLNQRQQSIPVLIEPVTRLALLESLAGQESVAEPDKQVQPLLGCQILLVEDNELNQVVARLLLSRLGAQVVIAANGQQAIEYLQQAMDIDLVLMDAHMPVMDGFEATRHIRQQLRLTLPVIAMTAGVTPAERGQCLAAGMDDFIGKPVDEQQLIQVLMRYLNRQRRQSEPDAQIEQEADIERVETDQQSLLASSGEQKILPDELQVASYSELQAFLQLYQLAAQDPEQQQALHQLLRQMPEHCQQRWSELQRLRTAAEWSELARALHSLRGSLGTLGAQKLAEVAHELELRISSPELEGLDRLWQQLEQQLQLMLAQVQHWLAVESSKPD